MRSILVAALALALGCGGHHDGNGQSDGSNSGGPDACVGLQCQVVNCAAMGMPATTISGTVFAPNGTLPIYDVNVYVPNTDPGPFMSGVQCGNCADPLPGEPIVSTTTDEAGNFTLAGIPAGANIPVVITIGKWRRQLMYASIPACQTTMATAADTTLPKSRDDMTPNTATDGSGKPKVDMPLIAISTGSADSLECLVRRLGIADKEITTDAQGGAVQLFSDNSSGGKGVQKFSTGFGGGTGSFSDSQTLWGTATDPGKLATYDIVILSCEGGQYANTKPQQAMDHLKAYADMGGRVFLSHWHNIWIEGATTPVGSQKPAVWTSIATWSNGGDTTGDDTIDEVNNPKGMSFATWMLNVGGSPMGMRDDIPILSGTGRNTCTSVDETKGEQWVYWTSGANNNTQNFQFETPNEVSEDQRCGKVVFSDMHVSGGPVNVGMGYPTSCGTTTTLSPQEKALAFMFFDISSCVGSIF